MNLPSAQKTSPVNKHDVYYEGNKKNEMNDLKRYFKTVLTNPDMEIYRREVIKKIVLYTTQGIDTSRFYPEMVIASGAKDLIEKKLVYSYLTIYSNHNVDFARMAINTFTKDAYSPNPNVRAISIRHLSNLRFKGREEYVMPILLHGLDDFSSIVKKACLMGITKLITEQNRSSEEPIRNEELLNKLYGMLRDQDSHVVACTMEAINEIEPEGIAMSKKLAHYLIENLENFGEMQLATILGYVELYDPKDENEILNFLNKLDSKIRSQNLSLVLAISKIYLKYAKIQENLMDQIQEKIKSHLLSFIFSSSPEIAYIALKEILYMIKKYELKLYIADVKKFYILENNPTYIKKVKIELMHLNCDNSNFGDVVNEFTEYIRDESIIDEVMEAFNELIMKLSLNEAKIIIKTLNDIVVNLSDKQFICNASIKTIRAFLRRYPQEFNIFEHTFYIYAKGVSSTSARCAMVEIIGDFGEFIEDAVELLVWSESKIEDELKISLLRANVKLFFKRPVEMLNIIKNLFREVLTDEETRMPVKDYAAMLYRGLQNDIEEFKESFVSCRSFSEGVKVEHPDYEFNTLESVYLKPVSSWLIDKTKYIELLEEMDYDKNIVDDPNEHLTPEEITEKNRSLVDLNSDYTRIDIDDIDKEFEMSAEEFEVGWEEYEIGSSITRMVKQIELLTEETLEELFGLWGIRLVASMESEESIKQYYSIRLNKGDKVCVELTIMKEVETFGLIIKTENEELAGFISKYIEDFMRINEIL